MTWVNSQAVDIGFPAICALIECWPGHLTPSECVSLADRVSRGRDKITNTASAELALTSLRYAGGMSVQEIHRALSQCEDQNKDLLRRACRLVEVAIVQKQQLTAAAAAAFSAANAGVNTSSSSSTVMVAATLLGVNGVVNNQQAVVAAVHNSPNFQNLNEIFFMIAHRWEALFQWSMKCDEKAAATAAAAAAAASAVVPPAMIAPNISTPPPIPNIGKT